jgi:hypothetical protein
VQAGPLRDGGRAGLLLRQLDVLEREFPDGTISQCDRVDGGGTPPDVDAGATPSACAMNACTRGVGGNAFCKLACGDSAATCVMNGGIEHCMP